MGYTYRPKGVEGMPWRISSAMSERHEFVLLAAQERANIRQLCQRFGVSSATAYKWLHRFEVEGLSGLEDVSRRPHHSPARTTQELERAVIALRQKHPAWGCRKLRRRLLDLGHQTVPSASTITAILRRHQLLDPKESVKHQAFQRFERAAPNELWQMDFKGEFPLLRGRCYPLTILDDHSRFAIGLKACARNTKNITQNALIQVFRRYGLPATITCDNGSPWGCGGRSYYTALSVWLMRLSIGISHSRPHHPQTQGKDERFHRSLEAEVLRYQRGDTLKQWQQHFDLWRDVYNTERPHESLDMNVPASRYQPSPRTYPERLPPIEYGPTDIVRKVRHLGHIKFHGRDYHVGSAFYGLQVALRHTTNDGLFDLFFCQHRIGRLNLADH
jgi:transposase InsO family protein